jgi:hypothetical protein
MYPFGLMLASVAIPTYALDSYPTRSGEVSCFLNFARVGGGFTALLRVTYRYPQLSVENNLMDETLSHG